MALDMTTALTIKANVKGEEELRGLQKGLNKVAGSSKKTAGAFDRLKKASSSLTGVIASLGAQAAAVGFIKAGIDAQRTQKTIAALADQYGETARVQQFASEAAQKFGMGQQRSAKAVADLFGRLRPMGISLENIEKTFLGVNQAALRMNLSTADTEGVMLQLSQALGSGVLQGDEFRSVMERLPAIGQAVADTLGIQVGELKQFSSDGMITTDVIIKAMDKLKELEAPPPDSFKRFKQAQEDLATAIGTILIPVITPLTQALTFVLNLFNKLPGPIKALIVGVGALGVAAAALVVPLGLVVTAFGAIQGAMAGLAGMKFIALLSGWVGSMGPVVAAFAGIVAKIKAVGLIVAAVFTGPAAPFILGAVAVGGLIAALLKFEGFREVFVNIGKGVLDLTKTIGGAVGNFIKDAFQGIGDVAGKFVQVFKTKWSKVKDIIIAPFKAAVEFIPKQIKRLIDSVTNAIRRWWNNIMKIIGRGRKAASGGSSSSGGSVQGYAEGGFVSGPTLAVVGEGKAGGEYILPSHKVGGFINNWLSGVRGGAAIPKFAEGGFVSGGSPNINIKTGPVMQMSNGQQYVTVNDLQSALSSFSASVFSNSRTAGGRRFQGIS